MPKKPDPSRRDGAELLAETIIGYWKTRGYDVDVTVVCVGFDAMMRERYCVIRSDLINGYPRDWRTSDTTPPRIVEAPPAPRVSKRRACLRCGVTFQSQHAGNRMCDDCRDYAATRADKFEPEG